MKDWLVVVVAVVVVLHHYDLLKIVQETFVPLAALRYDKFITTTRQKSKQFNKS